MFTIIRYEIRDDLCLIRDACCKVSGESLEQRVIAQTREQCGTRNELQLRLST